MVMDLLVMALRNTYHSSEADVFLRIFRTAKLVTCGSIFAVAAVRTVATLIGYDVSTQTDVQAAVVGGGLTTAVLAKMSLLA
jgi:hypothetical protein